MSELQRTNRTNLYRDKRTKIYYVVAKRGGKQIKESLKTKSREIADEKLTEWLKDHSDTQRGDDLTWKEVREVWQEVVLSRKSPGTQEDYLSRLDSIERHWPGLADMKIRSITKLDCQIWIARRQTTFIPKKVDGKLTKINVSPRRLNAELMSLKWIFAQAIELHVILRNPAEELEPAIVTKRHPEIPSDEDFDKVIAALRMRRLHNAADLAEFIGYCGCRIEEVAHIRGRDIDGKFITIRAEEGNNKWRPKNAEDRKVEINPAMRGLLARIQERRGRLFDRDKPVFPQRSSLAALGTTSKIVGVKKINHRKLRRFFVRKCIEQGIDFQTTADWVGHHDGGVLVAQVYSFLARPHAARMAERFTYSTAR